MGRATKWWLDIFKTEQAALPILWYEDEVVDSGGDDGNIKTTKIYKWSFINVVLSWFICC